MITLKKGYQIDSDDRQYILLQTHSAKDKEGKVKRDENGKPIEAVDTLGYFRQLADCLNFIARIEGYDAIHSKQLTLGQAIDELRGINREIKTWLEV